MAGKKDKAKKGDKKPSLLPKTIGESKLPKDARRQLTRLARHPVIADLIASGLMAIAQRIRSGAGNAGSVPEAAPEATPAPAAPTPSAEAPAPAEAAPAKPPVKRVRKAAPAADAVPAAEAPKRRGRQPASAAAKPAAPEAETPATTPAKAPPPRRTRKTADTGAKPRTRRAPPKTDS